MEMLPRELARLVRHSKRWIPELDTPDYPEPVVDLKESRQQALTEYGNLGS